MLPGAPPPVLSIVIRHDGGKNDLIALVNIRIVPGNLNTREYDLKYEGKPAGRIKVDLRIHLRV